MTTTPALVSSKQSRIEALRKRHTALSDKIEDMQKSPSTADFFLRQLKKQKLAIKEEIEGIRQIKSEALGS